MNFKIKYLYFFAVFFTLLFLFSFSVSAAELFIGPSNQPKAQAFASGDEVQANVSLNAEGEPVDAVQADIIFPDKLLELKEIRNGNSIVNFWITQPKASEPGAISFSGIIPGGYAGTKGHLFSLVFLAKSAGLGAVSFDKNANVLLDDGKGTQASLKISSLQFSVSKSESAVRAAVEPLKDYDPPEDFTPEIVQNPEIFNGKYFLVFAAQDKKSGINHYEIYETKTKTENLTAIKWNAADSTYVLQDQNLQSFIYVKAIDGSGNGRIETIQPRNFIKKYEVSAFWFIIILIAFIIISFIIVAYLLKRFLWKRKA